MNATIKPNRDSGIEANALPDGYTVLYNARTNLACTLTPLAALVWEFCDGTNTSHEIIEQLESIKELPQNPSLHEEVTLLLKDLVDSGLVLVD